MKILPALSNNHIPNDTNEFNFVSQRIDAAKRAREVMRLGSAGELQHMDPTSAQEFLDATVDIYDLLDKVDQRVRLEKRAGQLDMIFVLRLITELDKQAAHICDLFFYVIPTPTDRVPKFADSIVRARD